MAMTAVSLSRISPTRTMSGSDRRIDFEGGGEGQAGLDVELDLVDALQRHLDRVLDGDDVLLGRVERGQRRVEGGRLARAGRAADQDGPVGLGVEALVGLEQVLVEAEIGEPEHHARLVEHPHDDLLAVDGRERGHPEVDALAAHVERDATVLGDPVLGDVHVGHDLQAGGDGRGDGPRSGRHVVEHAVDPVADAQVGGGGLDVDVRGPLVQRLEDEQVDVADDRRFLGGGLDVVDAVVGARPVHAERRLHGHVGRITAAVEHPADVGADLGPGGHDHDEVAADDRPQVVHGEHVGGIRRGHHGNAVVLGDDDDVVVTGRRLGNAARLGKSTPTVSRSTNSSPISWAMPHMRSASVTSF